MPSMHIKLFEGRALDKKRELAAAITRETCQVLGCGPEAVDIIFEDQKKHDWASAGKLWSDRD